MRLSEPLLLKVPFIDLLQHLQEIEPAGCLIPLRFAESEEDNNCVLLPLRIKVQPVRCSFQAP